MLEGIKALLNSEKALVGGILTIAASVFVIQGIMTVDNWQTYTQNIFGLYVGGKTLQGAVSMWADTKKVPSETKIEAKIETKTETKTEEKTS